jgi:hypothetical protein
MRTVMKGPLVLLRPPSARYASTEGFGWAMILEMYFSIPEVPIIALVLRGWAGW